MSFNHKHLIDITEYSADDIMAILETAVKFKEVNERRIKQVPTLKGFTVVNMFNEPSTRTRSSFEMAEKRLSASSLNFGGSSTSTVKGESLVDTVETLCSYKVDMIVVRDKHAGVPRKIADVSGVHVIDAGDGKHQHPTQALLDLYTIWQTKGRLDGLKVGVVGDIGHSRVCGSLIPALKIMGCEVTVIARPRCFPLAPRCLAPTTCRTTSTRCCPSSTSCTCCASSASASKAPRTPACASTTCCTASPKSATSYAPRLHRVATRPINRGVELDSFMADHPERSVILDQVYAGILTRMAALYLLLGGSEDGITA